MLKFIMINYFESIQKAIFSTILEIAPEAETLFSVNDISFDYNKDSAQGDISTNIALRLAKRLGKTPSDLAIEIAEALNKENASEFEINALNGFLNLKLSSKYILNSFFYFENQFHNGENFLPGKGKNILLEFGQPNTHKAFHVGHLKSAITGLALSNMYEHLGYKVIRANYFGDVGLHVAKCVFATYFYLSQENGLELLRKINMQSSIEVFLSGSDDEASISSEKSLGEELNNKFNSDHLVFDDVVLGNLSKNFQVLDNEDIHLRANIIDKLYSIGSKFYKELPEYQNIIRDINKKIYSRIDENVNFLYSKTREYSIAHQKDAFAKLGVVYDRQYPESEVWQKGLKIIGENLGEGKVFVQDKDTSIILNRDLLSAVEQKHIKTFVYITQDNVPTYSGKELGLDYLKLEEYPDVEKYIWTTSVEQKDFFLNVEKALELLGINEGGKKFEHIAFGWLLRNNKKQSSRMGESVKGIELINEIVSKMKENNDSLQSDYVEKLGIAALKFLVLSQELHTDINYDLDRFLSFTGFSAIYVMYALVRAKKIISKANISNSDIAKFSEAFLNSGKELELDPVEKNVYLQLFRFNQVLNAACTQNSPHLICHYAYDLASLFSNFYNDANILSMEDGLQKNHKLLLTSIIIEKLEKCFEILGIATVDEM
jgi:arginyl-tRNA synthetase